MLFSTLIPIYRCTSDRIYDLRDKIIINSHIIEVVVMHSATELFMPSYSDWALTDNSAALLQA